MKRNQKIGLLPLYLKLYDDTMPQYRGDFDSFLRKVTRRLAAGGATVTCARVCRGRSEVEAAVALFARQDVDCVVTLHLVYSPSLESAPVLARTPWPLIVLDTTRDADFGRRAPPARIMHNHGVHGVMDFCSILRRLGRAFEIVAGHPSNSNVMERVLDLAAAAVAARRLRGARALRLGTSFKGMGDFAVHPAILRRQLGIRIDQLGASDLSRVMKAVRPAEIQAEVAADRRRYSVRVEPVLHRRAVQAGLGLRRLLARRDYTGFSVNFQAFATAGSPPMPFAEISKAMARGIGFGGEGDILTGCLVGALATGFGATTFTEIFCSDWRGGSLFLSHMGEINPDVVAARPRLVERHYDFLGGPTTALVGAIKPGPAVFVNLVPGPTDNFDLLVAPVEMLRDSTRPDMEPIVRGWMKPPRPVAEWLEDYSRHGGTHHSALVLGAKAEAVAAFGRFAGVGVQVIG